MHLWWTNDGGRTWREAEQPTPATNVSEQWVGFATQHLAFVSVVIGAGTPTSKLWRSTDGGKSWHVFPTP